MRYSTDKVIDAVARGLIKSGLWALKSTKRHVRLENVESHAVITVPKTPSDYRATKNWLHQVRRHGVNLQEFGA